jgi:uncharacterized protein
MGGLIRLIIIAAIVWFVWQQLKRFVGQTSGQAQPSHQPPPDRGNNQLMQPCAFCKVHIPEGESTQSRGYYFCCEAHRNAFFKSEPR